MGEILIIVLLWVIMAMLVIDRHKRSKLQKQIDELQEILEGHGRKES